MIDITKPLRVDTPARVGMGAADAAYAAYDAGWCDACIGKQYVTRKPIPEQAAALQPGEAQGADDRSLLAAVLRSRGKSNTLHDIMRAADMLDAAPPAAQVTATDLERIAAYFENDSNLDHYICCNGRDCGCQGATAGTYAAYKIRALAGDGK